jgi:hypothetical protein
LLSKVSSRVEARSESSSKHGGADKLLPFVRQKIFTPPIIEKLKFQGLISKNRKKTPLRSLIRDLSETISVPPQKRIEYVNGKSYDFLRDCKSDYFRTRLLLGSNLLKWPLLRPCDTKYLEPADILAKN